MKALRISTQVLFLFAFVMIASCGVTKTRGQKEADVRSLLDSNHFVFIAESANPMSGGNIRLTSMYRLTVSKDTVNSFLPYYGTAYRAPMGSTQSPLTFISTDFSYDAKTSANGAETISIRLNEPDDPDMITLSISPSGYGTLHVNSINRQPISFHGYITSPTDLR